MMDVDVMLGNRQGGILGIGGVGEYLVVYDLFPVPQVA